MAKDLEEKSESGSKRKRPRLERDSGSRRKRPANIPTDRASLRLSPTQRASPDLRPVPLSRFNQAPLGQAMMVYYRGLATLVKTGVPLSRALQLMSSQCEHLGLRQALQQCLRGLDSGSSLSQAMRSHPTLFPTLQVALIQLGEQTGSLHLVLDRLAHHSEKATALRAQLTSSLLYPLLVCLSCLAMVVVIPAFTFKGLFSFLEGLHVALPWPTRVLVAVMKVLGSPALLLVAAGLGLLAWQASIRVSRGFWEKLPGLGAALRTASAAELARSLATMYGSGIPILKALDLLGLRSARDRMQEGSTLHQALVGSFPPFFVQMVAAGEEAGNVARMLERAADMAEEQVEHSMQVAMAALQPLVLALVGFMVGFMLLAIMTPLIKVAQSL